MKTLIAFFVMQTLLSATPAMQTGVPASPQVLNLWPATPPGPAAKTEGVGKPWPLVDAWRVWFDGSKESQRLTRFLDFKGCKATNYVVSDDGRLMAFQLGISGDEAGVDHGLFLMDLAP